MTALLFIGKPDYDAVKPFHDDLLLRKTLGLARLRPLKPCAIALTLPKIVGRSLPEFTGGVCPNLREESARIYGKC